MGIYFSPSSFGFYRSENHPFVPEDAVELTDDEYVSLMEAQANGLRIETAPDGRPRMANPSAREQLAALRARRDALLRESDFTQIPDAPLNAPVREAWRAYRQTLRDLPELYADDPASVVWPTPPNEATQDADG